MSKKDIFRLENWESPVTGLEASRMGGQKEAKKERGEGRRNGPQSFLKEGGTEGRKDGASTLRYFPSPL